MKKIICLLAAAVCTASLLCGCAKKAEMQKIDAVKVTAVQISNGKTVDADAAVEAFNKAQAGKVVTDTDYKTTEPMVFVTADGVVEVFPVKEDKYIVSSKIFEYDFEIESAELTKLFDGE